MELSREEFFKQIFANAPASKQKAPVFFGRTVDLYKLANAVAERGGAEHVSKGKQWMDVAKQVNLAQPNISKYSRLRRVYDTFIRSHLASDGSCLSSMTPNVRSQMSTATSPRCRLMLGLEVITLLNVWCWVLVLCECVHS